MKLVLTTPSQIEDTFLKILYTDIQSCIIMSLDNYNVAATNYTQSLPVLSPLKLYPNPGRKQESPCEGYVIDWRNFQHKKNNYPKLFICDLRLSLTWFGFQNIFRYCQHIFFLILPVLCISVSTPLYFFLCIPPVSLLHPSASSTAIARCPCLLVIHNRS